MKRVLALTFLILAAPALAQDESDRQLTGRVVGGDRGQPALATPDGKVWPLSDPDRFRSLPRGLPVTLKASIVDGALQVKSWKPEFAAAWDDVKGQFPIGQFPDLHRTFQQLERTTDDLNRPGQMGPDDVGRLVKWIRAFQKSLHDAYSDIPDKDSAKAEALCLQHEKVRSDLKALYGRGQPDNYRPDVYRQIFENARSAVAILTKRGARRFFKGSGVLIGKGLVLTCKHCVEGLTADELEVSFDFTRAEQIIPTDAYSVARHVIHGETLKPELAPEATKALAGWSLDFALIEIKPNAGGRADEKYPLAKISTHRLHRDDAIYVIGYPQGSPRIVHDNAFVLFPFIATEPEYLDLRMFVCAETQGSKGRGSVLGEFLKSYVADGRGNYLNFSERRKNPTIAVDSDTSHGDSGAGAYDRLTGTLIGLLMAGEQDLGTPYSPGWQRHEAILPIVEVVRQLDQRKPGWRKEHGVTVE